MLPSPEVHENTQRFDDRLNKLDEIRTICRLHAYPTSQWENLRDLPARLSQDAGLRSDLSDIVRSLQRGNLNLPDVLDLLFLAVGGSSAPKRSREFTEELNLLGGFLSNIGRWPATDSQPILAPGEIPENIQKFTRPQPRQSQPAGQPAAQVEPQPRPQSQPVPEPQPRSAPVRLYETPRREVSPTPRAEAHKAPANPNGPGIPNQVTAAQQPASPQQSKGAQQPSPLDTGRQNSTRSEQPEPLAASPSTPARQANPNAEALPADPSGVPVTDISRALARLERGNLELRAHLDSIDQRISRMEPLLESDAPTTDIAIPEPDAPNGFSASAQPLPTLVHRAPTPRESFHAEALHARETHTESIHTNAVTPRRLASSPVHTEPVHTEPIHAEPIRKSSAPATPIPFNPDHREARSSDAPRWPDPTLSRASEGRSSGSSQSLPTTSAPRFSRFSRDPVDTEAEPLTLRPEPQPSPEHARTGPMPLPHGFFGTVPESDRIDPVDSIADPSPGKGRRFALVATILILLGLVGGAGFLYMRSVNSDNDQANSTGITPVPAPNPSGVSTPPSQGPLTANPSRPSAAKGYDASNDKVLGARSAFTPRQAAEEPNTAGGFRPAGTFVSSSVMDGRLISAPPPSQPRVPANSGLKGIVVMEANISNTGQVEDVHVLGGSPALRFAAIDAVRDWRYKPYTQNGTPVEVRTIIRVDFNEYKSQPAQRSGPFPS